NYRVGLRMRAPARREELVRPRSEDGIDPRPKAPAKAGVEREAPQDLAVLARSGLDEDELPRGRGSSLQAREGRLEDRGDPVALGGLPRVFGAPLPPLRPPVRNPVFDPRHERVVCVLVDLPDPLVCEDVPVILRLRRDPRTFRRAPLPLFQRGERELPPVRGDLPLSPEAVGVDPGMFPADGHPRVFLALELLEIVVAHGLSPRCCDVFGAPWGRWPKVTRAFASPDDAFPPAVSKGVHPTPRPICNRTAG